MKHALPSRGRALIPGTIRGKLFLVFAVIIASALIGAFAARRGNDLVQDQLTLITERTVPALVTAHRLSEVTTAISATAAAVVSAEQSDRLEALRARLAAQISAVRELVIELANSDTGAATVTALERQVAEFAAISDELAEVVNRRLDQAAAIRANIHSLSREHQAFNDAIRPLVAEQLAFLDRKTADVVESTRSTVVLLNEVGFKGLIPVLSTRGAVVEMREALRLGAAATATEDVDAAWEKFVAASSVIGRNISTISASPVVAETIDTGALAQLFDRILGFGTGNDSVFERRLRSLNGATQEKIAPAEIDSAFTDFERRVQSAITLIRGRTVTAGIDLSSEVDESLAAMNRASRDDYGALLRLEALGNRAVGTLNAVPFAGSQEQLAPLQRDFDVTETEISEVLRGLGRSENLAPIVNQAEGMMAFGRGADSILEQRSDELRLRGEVETLLLQANARTSEMNSVAADIVQNARAGAQDVAGEIAAALAGSRTALAAALVLSMLAIAGAIVYVNRSLGSRLGAFSNAALSLAEGEVDVQLPEPRGNDEIARLMRALAVFRDTAAEMETSNLREIALMRQRLIDAIESINEGFAFFDADERLVIANSRCREEFLQGVSDLMVPGVAFADILCAVVKRGMVKGAMDDPEGWVAWRLAAFRDPSDAFVLEYTDGLWVQVSERRTADGGTVIVYSDITTLKEREFQLTGAKEDAEAANAAKSSFLANVSHELRTPLTSILGFARIVQKRFHSAILPRLDASEDKTTRAADQIRRNLQIVLQEGDRLTKLVNDVLDLEKIEAGEMAWNIQAVSISEVISQAASATESLYQARNLELDIDIAPDLPAVEADHDRLVQVLINLISNAVKFTKSGKIACRAWARQDGRVWTSVSDPGTGIAFENQAAIFEKFKQVGDTLTEKPSGTGLGLPICREIIQHLGGEISVESELGNGSTFTFWLKAVDGDAVNIPEGHE